MVNSGAKVLQKNGICKFKRRKMEENVNFVYKKNNIQKKQSALFDGLFF